MTAKSETRFKFFVYTTIVLTYLVILAGAVVRTTQSGMGCPDWPKCFGQWIPPTDVSELPANYQEIYAHRGYADTAFNAYHTWVEYVNRLFGVLLGISVFISLVLSFRYLKSRALVFWLTLSSFILIGFQGWLGSLVVSSNLAPTKITVHMLVALIILAVLIYLYHLISKNSERIKVSSQLQNWFYVALLFTALQVMLGTQVRQEVDEIAKQFNFANRNEWVYQLSALFKFHRSFSILLLLLNAYLIKELLKAVNSESTNRELVYLTAGTIALEILAGVLLSYFSFPAAVQPLHLLLASLLFGWQLRLALLLQKQ
jgi:cytochrome c oxidase assembly protein subunit 15